MCSKFKMKICNLSESEQKSDFLEMQTLERSEEFKSLELKLCKVLHGVCRVQAHVFQAPYRFKFFS